ncbi:MAG: hypothetical protein KC415_23505, partial [Anaerolineales bacterium]|nr:hypothetical protein [Anaerolineales bacterium]
TVADDYFTAMAVIEEQMQFPNDAPEENANGHTERLLLLLDALQAEPLTANQQAAAVELQYGLANLAESLNGSQEKMNQIVNEHLTAWQPIVGAW